MPGSPTAAESRPAYDLSSHCRRLRRLAVADFKLPPPPTQPDVSIIIPSHNQFDFTLKCLRSIARHIHTASFEVIVADDASDLAVFQALRSIPHLRVVRNFHNLGFLRTCNRAASQASGRYLLLLNNDTEVTDGFIDYLLQVFATRPRAGLVGSKLVYPDGTLQEAGGICWRDGSAWNYGRNQDAALPEFNYVRETDYCSGAAILIPKPLWQQLQGFDDIYAPAYYEDTDLAFRVRQAGYRTYYQPRSLVIHHEGRSNGVDDDRGIKRYQARNRTIFLDRWSRVLASHRPNATEMFRARERSLNKKLILFIDHYVPRPDKDAGSRNIMTYIRFFLAEGFVVKFIGDNFFPEEPYTNRLQDLGVEVLVGPRFAADWQAWVAANAQQFDYIFLSRAHTSARWIDPLRAATSAPLLFYGHDLVSRTLQRAYDDLGDPGHLQLAREYFAKEQYVFNRVDWIFYPSQDEVDHLRRKHPALKIGRLPLLALEAPDPIVPPFDDRNGLLFVGGFDHPPNRDAVKWFLADVWPELARLIAANVSIVGSNAPPDIVELQSPRVRVFSNLSDEDLLSLYRRSRVAIVPLRYGGGIKGKVLEAMHLGTPVVATPIGAEGLQWEQQHLVCAETSSFVDAVASLYADPEKWRSVQAEAWRFLSRNYSTGALKEALSKAIPELACPSLQ